MGTIGEGASSRNLSEVAVAITATRSSVLKLLAGLLRGP
jgi:hypothetical protein